VYNSADFYTVQLPAKQLVYLVIGFVLTLFMRFEMHYFFAI